MFVDKRRWKKINLWNHFNMQESDKSKNTCPKEKAFRYTQSKQNKTNKLNLY